MREMTLIMQHNLSVLAERNATKPAWWSTISQQSSITWVLAEFNVFTQLQGVGSQNWVLLSADLKLNQVELESRKLCQVLDNYQRENLVCPVHSH